MTFKRMWDNVQFVLPKRTNNLKEEIKAAQGLLDVCNKNGGERLSSVDRTASLLKLC